MLVLVFVRLTSVAVCACFSVEEILRDRHGDPETILSNLGFGCVHDSELDRAKRIPSRFLSEPSHAAGISLDDFLRQNPDVERSLYASQDSFQFGLSFAALTKQYSLPATTTTTAAATELPGQSDDVTKGGGKRVTAVDTECLTDNVGVIELLKACFKSPAAIDDYFSSKNVPKTFLRQLMTSVDEETPTNDDVIVNQVKPMQLCDLSDLCDSRVTCVYNDSTAVNGTDRSENSNSVSGFLPTNIVTSLVKFWESCKRHAPFSSGAKSKSASDSTCSSTTNYIPDSPVSEVRMCTRSSTSRNSPSKRRSRCSAVTSTATESSPHAITPTSYCPQNCPAKVHNQQRASFESAACSYMPLELRSFESGSSSSRASSTCS